MSTEPNNPLQTRSPRIYQIRFEGQLDSHWTGWFEGLSINADGNSSTLITGPIADQAALYGLLKKIRDLGLPLLSVNQVDSDQVNTSNSVQPNDEPPDKE